MAELRIFTVNAEQADERLMRALAEVLSYEEPAQVSETLEFWRDWFSNRIPGEKFTLVAKEHGVTLREEYVGVVRLWKTPYLANKWLLEGLEVIAPSRKRGIGTALVKKAIKTLLAQGVESISANISRDNTPSIALHLSLGFEKRSSGSYNSWGEYRELIDEYVLILAAKTMD